MNILWINESAERIGGCERYIEETVAHLHTQYGVRSSLLYRNVNGTVDHRFATTFTATGGGVFPMVAVKRQIAALAPDLIFVHRLTGTTMLHTLADAVREQSIPLVRFFHDYQLFCPREHKYTTFGKNTCTRAVGVGCVGCLGFVQRSETFPGIALRSIGSLIAEQRENQKVLDAVVVASKHMAQEVEKHGFAPKQTHVLPLYARHEDDCPIEREPNHLLYVGQLITGKGVDTLIRAMALLPENIRLTLAGGGRCETTYRRLAEEQNVTARIHFAGRLTPDALRELYKRATAVVMPSRFPEPFGLVGIEAMRYGTPIVASGVGGMTEWLKDGETGLSTGGAESVNTPSALATTIQRLLNEPELAAYLGKAARHHYETSFTPDQHITMLFRLFTHLIAEKSIGLTTNK